MSLAQRVSRRAALASSPLARLGRRAAHVQGVYGRVQHDEYEAPDFAPHELANRAASPLVRLVDAYRRHGHRAARLDPLNLAERPPVAALDPRRYGFALPDGYTLAPEYRSQALPPVLPELSDPDRKWATAGVVYGTGDEHTIVEVLERLQATYTRAIAVEFMSAVANKHEREWLSRVLEEAHLRPITREQRLRNFRLLAGSSAFDRFCAKRFPSVKRYGLEGAESMLVALDQIFAYGASSGIQEAVLVMPHRGRLNLLTQLLDFDAGLLIHKMKGKSEISDAMLERGLTGDVLSHLFCSPTLEHYSNPLRVHLLPNPSHLEAVNPVGLGFARALQIPGRARDGYRIGDEVMSVQCHGDAAWAGQGVVAECLNMQTLPHFHVGGTVRLVVNNQVGFTASQAEGRSSLYASDLAKMIGAPIFHVNADRPDSVAQAVTLACEYRNKFRKDVVIDLIAYRRWGHNELDEPSFTQPRMYNVVRNLKTPPEQYEAELVSDGVLSADEAKTYKDGVMAGLDAVLAKADSYVVADPPMRDGWSSMTWPKVAEVSPVTGVTRNVLEQVGRASVAHPPDFSVHPSLAKRHVAKRLEAIESGKNIDYATAEALAWGSLMLEGYDVRVSGQDSGRGTFSHRHALLVDQKTQANYVSLNSLDSPGRLEVLSSPLSEYAVLGFEQGASYVSPKLLPIWEAQYGDFHTGAAIIIDTFLGSSETKWCMQTGMTLLLPHGADVGTGPEHSSARIERFLQLTNEPIAREPFNPNMHVVLPTTAAQYFHLLRRQMVRSFRKPLIVFSPKATLRAPATFAALSDLTEGTSFQPVLADGGISDTSRVERVVVLSGKLYFQLSDERKKRGLTDRIAFVRVEEFSPFPYDQLEAQLATFGNAKSFVFAQEEPENAGLWTFAQPRLAQLGQSWRYIGRRAMAAPAHGVKTESQREADEIVRAVFADL